MEDQRPVFSAFAQKAAQRLDDKKELKRRKLYIPSMEEEITIRGLSRKDVLECLAVEDTEDKPDASDNYTIYMAVIEPSLKEIAKELKEAGKIVEYTDICYIFDMHERITIAQQIMDLSGVIGEKKVAVVNELKN